MEKYKKVMFLRRLIIQNLKKTKLKKKWKKKVIFLAYNLYVPEQMHGMKKRNRIERRGKNFVQSINQFKCAHTDFTITNKQMNQT